ncbi:MAG TPA: bifunctional class I SAM-dependent methyltransferase/GNAT family N-acetyltransferase, partial [Gaiellaceae bacterium]
GETSRERWQRRIDELDGARGRGEIDDESWFAGMADVYESAYLEGDNPRAQSGFGGDEVRWEAGRRPIAEAIDSGGTFLDIGCASGHLLECLVEWAPHRIEPYGLDLSPALAELARRRLPQWADRIFVGNALTWEPPLRFDFVRTELVYVPDDLRRQYVERLLDRVVAPGGRLVLCGYGSPRSNVPTGPVRSAVRAFGFEPELELEAEAPEGGGPILELAVLRAAAESLRVRRRTQEDLGTCVAVIEALHRSDGYPIVWPEDPAGWLSPAGTFAAWVAEVDGRIAGHIALRAAAADTGAGIWSDATGLPPERLAAITRLFVSAGHRGAGLGGALLDAACAEAAAGGLRPVLDVTEKDRAAMRLYERRGWRRVHSEPWRLAPETQLHYYVSPDTSPRAATPAP